MESLRINEIFWSAQGEGLRSGFPSVFIRFAGCSLRCGYCDSKDAWDSGEWRTDKEILADVDRFMEKYPGSQVIFTGGEPLEQRAADLAVGLKKKGYFLTVETSGVYNSSIHFDWWTVSPKDIREFAIHPEIRQRISELKLIVNENLDPGMVRSISSGLEHIPLYLQPLYPDADRYERTFRLFQDCIKMGLKNVRVGDQLHRQFNIP